MLRLPSRATACLAQSSLAPARTITGRRFVSTTPPHLRRSWKSSAARWGVAIAGIYWYTTSPIFAEAPSNNLLNPNLDKVEEETAGTSLEALTSRPRRQQSRKAAVLASAADAISTENASTTAEPNTPSAAQDLEDEADQQGAFNPETGEINWDCPCLGGMAHGPCGPQFREAFSCFVYSTEEPKGMDCIEKFQGMQDCFKEHPDVYKGELDDEANEGEYDEVMAAEKEELAKEIKERRLKMGVEADGSKRILEESSTPAEGLKQKEPKPKKEKGKKPTAGDEDSALKPKANDSRSSQTLQEPNIDEVFPKAAHDAMDAKVPQTEK